MRRGAWWYGDKKKGTAMKKIKTRLAAIAAVALSAVLACGVLAGCSSDKGEQKAEQPEQTTAASLEGKSLNIYCGAGMTKPFQEIADAFKAETGCEMNITFANAAQIQTQINTTQEGDFFIAGSADELKPVSDYVATSTDLVKHIPVLVVPADNPKGIQTVSDLVKCDTLLLGDPESTPIGKIAVKAMTDAGVMEQVKQSGSITTSTTAPQIAEALAKGEGDAAIVWKENAGKDGLTILETPAWKTTSRPFRAPSSPALPTRMPSRPSPSSCRAKPPRTSGPSSATSWCNVCLRHLSQNVTEAASATSSRHCACW